MNSRNHLICHFIHGILGSSHKRDTSARKKLQWTVFHYIYHFVSLHCKETLCLLSKMSWTRIAHNSVASCLWKYHQVASPCWVSPKYWYQWCKYLFCHSFHCNVFSGRLSRQVYKCLISLPSSVLGNGFLTYLYCEQTVVWQFRLLVEEKGRTFRSQCFMSMQMDQYMDWGRWQSKQGVVFRTEDFDFKVQL